MSPKNNQAKEKQVNPISPTAEGDQDPGMEEYSPIYFHHENEDYGFMSNFYMNTFRAPDPATWLFKEREIISTDLGNSSTQLGDAIPDTMTFRCSEQYYMYCKAIYFCDENAAREIMAADSATKCKSVGRSVRGFSEKAWQKHDLKVRVMEAALWWKFGGGQLGACLEEPEGIPIDQELGTREERHRPLEGLGRQLSATGEVELVEAAGQDRYWGIGYRLKDGPQLWRESWGRNQLGKSLMKVRGRLRELVDEDEGDAQAGYVGIF